MIDDGKLWHEDREGVEKRLKSLTAKLIKNHQVVASVASGKEKHRGISCDITSD